MSDVIIDRVPELGKSILIVGMGGWANAGEVSTASALYVINQLKAKKFACINIDRFNDFQSLRPIVQVEKGVIRSLDFASNDFYYWKSGKKPHDLIIFHGTEPQLLWRDFIRCFFQVLQPFTLDRIFTIGGVFDHVPHTIDPPITAVVPRKGQMKILSSHGITGTEYTGPASFHSFILTEAKRRGIPSISLWGHAPSYIQSQNPKVIQSMIQKLSRLIGMEFDLQGFEEPIQRMESQLEHAMEEKPELREFVQQLEDHYLKDRPEETSRDSKVIRFEEWLKKLDSGGGDGTKNKK
ncbi:MAG: PAC2 family protein [Deltaproteobacteria bacterium]|nr:PAC2 family protein [Deltaproteobacteria bacterium]